MDSKISKGKWIVISVGINCCLVSLFVITQYLAVKGISIQTFVPRLIRFLLTVLVFVMIYRGVRWVTWLAILLFGITGIFSLISDNETAQVLAGIYLPSSVLLMFPHVKQYQAYKKKSKNVMQSDSR